MTALGNKFFGADLADYQAVEMRVVIGEPEEAGGGLAVVKLLAVR